MSWSRKKKKTKTAIYLNVVINMPLKPRNLRGAELNPVFHFQTKKDDINVFSHSLIKNARKTGCLKLAGRGLSSGMLAVYTVWCTVTITICYLIDHKIIVLTHGISIFCYFWFVQLVPEKVWNIHEADKEDIESRHNIHGPKDEGDAWWNQKTLTNLDLSSNVLQCISPNVQNLGDLTVLLVSARRTISYLLNRL